MKRKKEKNGFIALMTAIVFSFVLMITAATLSQTSFFSRAEILDAEYKERSSALAEACVDTALLKLAVDPSYTGPETVSVGSDTCEIVSVTGLDTIRTRAEFPPGTNQAAATNLEVQVDASNLSVISWNERASF